VHAGNLERFVLSFTLEAQSLWPGGKSCTKLPVGGDPWQYLGLDVDVHLAVFIYLLFPVAFCNVWEAGIAKGILSWRSWSCVMDKLHISGYLEDGNILLRVQDMSYIHSITDNTQ